MEDLNQLKEQVDMESASGNDNSNGVKKQLLQKLMSNLLNKPGRSVHELVNGIKDVIGAYKTYAKEIDTLSGVSKGEDSSELAMSPQPEMGQGTGSDVQRILQEIQAKKGESSPSVMTPPMAPPTDPMRPY